jgi:uncharacterized protein YndB with AHSA1/START domain
MKILLIIGILVAIFVIVAALQPKEFSVVRSTTIAAPPSIVFEQVDNLRNWDAWSPWAKLDPNMKVTFDGPASGVGAGYSWVGNNKVGEGRMTILESRPGELVRIKLEFIKPFKATNTTEFTFKPEGSGTHVTWNMYGDKNFLSKAMGLFMNMDKMVGGDFEKGLASMKSIAEQRAGKPAM